MPPSNPPPISWDAERHLFVGNRLVLRATLPNVGGKALDQAVHGVIAGERGLKPASHREFDNQSSQLSWAAFGVDQHVQLLDKRFDVEAGHC